MTAEDRDFYGRIVRQVWVEWAKEQPNPKPHHLLPWEELDEDNREVDRRIGETVAKAAIKLDDLHRLWERSRNDG